MPPQPSIYLTGLIYAAAAEAWNTANSLSICWCKHIPEFPLLIRPFIRPRPSVVSDQGDPQSAPCLFSIMIGPTHCVLCTTCCSSILLAIYYNELYYRNLLAAPARVKALFIVPLHIRRVYIFHVPYDHQTRNPPRYTYYMLLVVSHCTMNHSLILLDLWTSNELDWRWAKVHHVILCQS